jgi:branched-chain amino acid transport system substrate-binding protein
MNGQVATLRGNAFWVDESSVTGREATPPNRLASGFGLTITRAVTSAHEALIHEAYGAAMRSGGLLNSCRIVTAGLALLALTVACTEPEPAATGTSAAAPPSTAETVPPAPASIPTDSVAATDPSPASTEPPADSVPAPTPATGTPFVIGVVNTEGVPSLDFPEFRQSFEAARDYANSIGGVAGRPFEIVSCIAKGTPESSQACAQQMAEAKVELVLLGLDVFVDHPTYEAAGIPVIGMVPIFPPDYQAKNAAFLIGGNLSLSATVAKVATSPDFLGGKKIGILANDAAATASALGVLEPALAKAGAEVTKVIGGVEETDAGYQGLMREVTANNPDVIISLYGDAGCIGAMRARESLGITTPVVTTNVCANRDILSVVGTAAEGWHFAGAQGEVPPTPGDPMMEALAKVQGVPITEVNQYGFATVGFVLFMSMVDFANATAAKVGADSVSGAAIFEAIRTDPTLTLYGGGSPVTCGKYPAYPSVCGMELPVARFEDGKLVGLGNVDGSDLL